MSGEEIEKARAAAEAKNAVVGRPPRGSESMLAALRRYLTSEQYRVRRRSARDRAQRPE
ncbi:hypothetical protein [Nocardioides aquiterrae]|uniref:Uncharacterized protein n=1 Tax=Nocardioides aquiterrae TaxID=203799 RepID=A0ABN1UP21_9ACTN